MQTVLFITPLTHEACKDPLNGVRRYCKTRRWQLQVIEEVSASTDFSAILELWRPVGIIAACGAWFPEPKPIEKLFGSVPFVALDRDPAPGGSFRCLTVAQDNAATGREAARVMLSLGLRHYAYAGNHAVREWDTTRRDAYRKALKVHGFGCELFPGAGKGMADYPSRLARWLPTLPRPFGVFCANDWVADRVIGICNRLGLGVPRDCAVLGVDNDELICEHTNPPLTSICPDFERGGYLAAELLDRKIANPSLKPTCVRFSPILTVRRASTAGAGCTDAAVAVAVQMIRTRFADDIGVDDVAAVMGCSRRFAQSRFRDVVGKSIRDAIAEARMDRAFMLLRRPNQAIGSIASLCGFGTDANLRRIFRIRTGMSLSAWRTHNA